MEFAVFFGLIISGALIGTGFSAGLERIASAIRIFSYQNKKDTTK